MHWRPAWRRWHFSCTWKEETKLSISGLREAVEATCCNPFCSHKLRHRKK